MVLSIVDLILLRRMTADESKQFQDEELSAIAAQYPLAEAGKYDLNAAARDVWQLKAAALVEAEESFSSDGKTFQYGALADKALKMAIFYGAKASAAYSDYGYARSPRDDVDPLGEGSSA